MNWYEVCLLIGVIQGWFLSIGLLIKNWGKKKQNPFFLSLVALIAMSLLGKLVFEPVSYQANPHIWYLVDLVAYGIGPLWYLTILNSIKPRVQLQRSDWLLLSLILYHIGFCVFLLSLSRAELLSALRFGWYYPSFYLFCITVLVVNGGFLWKAHRVLQQHQDQRFPELLIKGQYAFLLIMAIWLGTFLLSVGVASHYNLNLQAYHVGFLSLALLTLAMAFLALVRPASFYFLTQTFDSSETYVLQQIADRVMQHMGEQQPFLRRDYSLADLARDVQANPVLTSKAVNRILKTTFHELMNGQRVAHFLRLAKEERAQHLTLWALAQEAGFGNKVTFYKAFRQQMGTTPKVYLDMQG